MTIDLALAFLVLVFGFLGLRSGGMRQLVRWIALLLAYFASRPAATFLTPYAAPDLGLSPHVVNVALSWLLCFAFYSLISLALRAAFLKAFPGWQNGRGDGALGFALGAAKGAVLLYAVLALGIFFAEPLSKAFGPTPPAVRDSRAIAFARRHDLFDASRVPALGKIESLLAAARTPAGGLAAQPELQRLLADPRVKGALQDGSLDRVLRSGDLSALENDPRLRSLLQERPAPADPAAR